MTRKKISLAYITNNADRNACYRKRKKGLIKKVSELSVLCGVEACVVVGCPCDKEPAVWPSPNVAISLYSSLNELSDEDQSKRVMSHEEFTSHHIKKVADKVTRFQRDNSCKEIDFSLHKCMAGKGGTEELISMGRMSDLNNFISQRKRDIKSMLQGVHI